MSPSLSFPAVPRTGILCLALATLNPFGQVKSVKGEPLSGIEEESSTVAKNRDMPGAPVLTNEDARVHHFEIPAPRGLITDRAGRPLAGTAAASRCAIRIASLGSGEEEPTFDAIAETVGAQLRSLETILPELELPDESVLREHWQYRRTLPLVFGNVLTPSEEQTFREWNGKDPGLQLETVYVREYPAGKDTAHLVGYVSRVRPDQHGPMQEEEPRWPPVAGKAGLEVALDEALRGTDGHLTEIRDPRGRLVERQVVAGAVPGDTVVTTIDLPMQQLACRILRESGRPGAFVVVRATDGDLLVSASHPSFDPGELSSGVSPARYREIAEADDRPLFNRAVSGAYPPGSIFKPVVALAALDRGVVNGLATRFRGPSSLKIAGRTFRNWNDEDEGPLDVRFALLRSCNTWFYQAGTYTGGDPIRSAAEVFGLGAAPDLPIPGVQAGRLPSSRMLSARQAVANFSIGQGDLLISPVQAALMMAGIANGRYLPGLRLVRQRQDPFERRVAGYQAPRKSRMLNFRTYDVNLVRAGMWGVVNHARGTGKAAALDFPSVYGKTGTAQWSSEGEERALAWFGGFLPLESGTIAFAVMTEGRRDERLFGGKNAAPMAGSFLRELVADPDRFGIVLPERRAESGMANRTTSSSPGAISRRSESSPARARNVPRQGAMAPEDRGTRRLSSGEARRERFERQGFRGEGTRKQTPAREWPRRYQEDTPGNLESDDEEGIVRRILNVFD